MGGGWRDYAEFLPDAHDRWYFMNNMGIGLNEALCKSYFSQPKYA